MSTIALELFREDQVESTQRFSSASSTESLLLITYITSRYWYNGRDLYSLNNFTSSNVKLMTYCLLKSYRLIYI